MTYTIRTTRQDRRFYTYSSKSLSDVMEVYNNAMRSIDRRDHYDHTNRLIEAVLESSDGHILRHYTAS